MEARKGRNTSVAVALVVVTIVAGLGGYALAANTMNRNAPAAASQGQDQLNALRNQMAQLNATISSLNSQIAQLDNTITDLRAMNSQDATTIANLQSQVASLQSQLASLRRAFITYYYDWESPCGNFFCTFYNYQVDWLLYANAGTLQSNGATVHITFYSGAGQSGSILCRQDIVIGSTAAYQIGGFGIKDLPSLAICGSGSVQAMSTSSSITQ